MNIMEKQTGGCSSTMIVLQRAPTGDFAIVLCCIKQQPI